MSKTPEILNLLPSVGVGYLRQSQLIPAILPFSGSTLWRKVNSGEFPKPVKLSARVTAWRVEDIRNWMAKVDAETFKKMDFEGRFLPRHESSADEQKDSEVANA